MRSLAVVAVVAGVLLTRFAGGVAHAEAEPAPQTPTTTTATPPPQLSAQPPNPLLAPVPPPHPSAQQVQGPQPKPRWVKPVGWVLIAGAIGFAAASIAVISSGPTSDQQRVDIGAGLGAGFIACALGGVIVSFAVH